MTLKRFCDRCDSQIPSKGYWTSVHVAMVEQSIPSGEQDYDLCDRCKQSLGIFLDNLPNRKIKYLEQELYPLRDRGTFGDVVARLHAGADPRDFHRQAWADDARGGFLGWDVVVRGAHLVRVLSEDGHHIEMTAEDFQASDWCEDRYDEGPHCVYNGEPDEPEDDDE